RERRISTDGEVELRSNVVRPLRRIEIGSARCRNGDRAIVEAEWRARRHTGCTLRPQVSRRQQTLIQERKTIQIRIHVSGAPIKRKRSEPALELHLEALDPAARDIANTGLA